MISLLPSREELASAGWGLEAFVGRRPAARPRIGWLPPFPQERRPSGPRNNVTDVREAPPFPAGSWPPQSAPGLVGGPSPALPQLCQVGEGYLKVPSGC